MIDIVVVLFGLGLNAALLIRADWLEPLGGMTVLLALNATVFLWLGIKILLYRQNLRGLASMRRDLQAMNEQAIQLNRQQEEQTAKLLTVEQAVAERSQDLNQTKQENSRLLKELEQARMQQARAEKDRQESQAQLVTTAESQAELVQFLSILQKHGRFIDFVMGDITRYPDDRVGAAARLVHQGCSKAIRDYFDIHPILIEDEGSQIELQDQQHPRKVRYIGHEGDSRPKKGRLLHRGWQTLKVDLPKRTQAHDLDRVIIAPAEIELKS